MRAFGDKSLGDCQADPLCGPVMTTLFRKGDLAFGIPLSAWSGNLSDEPVASQSHEYAIARHQDVLDAIRMRRPDAARFAMEQLIGTARMELSDALRAAKPKDEAE